MMQPSINSFDRRTIEQMRREMEAALTAVGNKYNLEFGVGRITFTPSDFRCKVTCVPRSAVPNANLVSGKNAADAVALAKQGCWILGIQPSDLTNTFNHPRLGNAQLTAYVARRHKYPFTVKTANGRSLKVSTALARELVRNKVVAA